MSSFFSIRVKKKILENKVLLLTSFRIPRWRQIYNQILNFIKFNHSDVVCNELQSLNSLYKMLLMQILLRLPVLFNLGHLSHEVIQRLVLLSVLLVLWFILIVLLFTFVAKK